MRPRVFLALAVMLVVAMPAFARQRPVVRISLEITASDDLKGIITSYLTRELRKIDDVIVSDTKPLYRISCVVLLNRNRAGYPIGYTLSFATTSTMPGTMTQMIANSKMSPQDAQAIASWNSNAGVLVNHFVQTCATDELQSVCRKLAASIDGELIESARQFAMSYLDAIESEQPEDDLRAAPTASLPGMTFEPVEQRPTNHAVQGEQHPEMHTRLLTLDDVKGLSATQIRNAINEVYARHGFYFGDPKTRVPFEKQPWYHPRRGVAQDQIEAEFTGIEAANVKLLGESRVNKGRN